MADADGRRSTTPGARRALLARLLSSLGLLALGSTLVTFLVGTPRHAAAKAALGVAALLAGLALSGPGGARRFLSGRAARFGVFTAASTALLVAALAIAAWIAQRRPVAWDLTRDRIHTLSDDTVRTLRALPGDVRVLAFYRQDEPAHGEARALLSRYAALSPRFRFEMVDPYRSPELVRLHRVSDAGPRTVAALGGEEVRVAEPTEEALTNALVRLSHPGRRVLYFTQGHGEPALLDPGRQGTSIAVRALEAEGLAVSPLSLPEKGEVPADAAAVLVAGPRRRFLDAEVAALGRYVERGGHLGVFLEPEASAGLDGLLRELSIEAGDDLVVDPDPASRVVGGSPVTPVLKTSSVHPVGASVAQTGVVFPTARSLVALAGGRLRPAPVALSAPTAWAETDLSSLYGKGARQDDGEKVGPIPLAMAVEWRAEGPPAREGRAFVAGDADFFTNGYQQMLGNLDFFLSAASWLAERDDRLVIRARGREASRLLLTEGQATTLKVLAVDVLPLLLLAAGLAVWLARRAR
jgi:ABC-type uncharacterized transport system involved in gliding motility auxiliary subunit